MTRRQLLTTALAGLGLSAIARATVGRGGILKSDQTNTFEVTKTDAEWKRVLTAGQYNVLRKQDTELAWSSPLNSEHRKGAFCCAGCGLPLFASSAKYDSGTGWPSFTAPIENAVATTVDRSLVTVRVEVHCRRCGGHIGHVFDDGPPPTGRRYCMNGVAMTFKPAS
jgi:peptide-methionine (R)-S-oxide reductase